MSRYFEGSPATEYLWRTLPVTPITQPPATMSCWFNCDEPTNVGTLMCISNKNSNDNQMRLILIGTAAPKELWVQYEGNDGSDSSAVTDPWTVDTWHHAAGVFPSTNSRIAYLDGANKVTEATAEAALAGVQTWAVGVLTYPIKIQYFAGALAEAGWWNAALNDDEIAALAEGYSPLLIRPQNLKHYLPLVRDADNDLIVGVQMVAGGIPEIRAHPRVFNPDF